MRDVDDEQTSMIASAVLEQRGAIVASIARLATRLRFDEHAAAHASDATTWPDVLRMRRDDGRAFLFVGCARGFGEAADDPEHMLVVRRWLRRFARLLDKRRGKRGPRIHGGYVIVGTHDAHDAHAWASKLTTMARAHRLQRDGAPARFVVRRLGDFWMAC